MTDGLDPLPAPDPGRPDPSGPVTMPVAAAGVAGPTSGTEAADQRPVAIRWGVATDVGQHRPVNQDSVLAERPLWIVADGMGGHAAGEVASQLALRTVRDALRQAGDILPSTAAIADAVRLANHAVLERSIADASLRGMGTTICGIALVAAGDRVGARLAIANVGDSRGYLYAGGELRQLTRDHSYVEDLVEAGEITPEEARTHPRRHIVTRALGVEPALAVDVWERPARIGERYLLCSDGLTNELDDAVIAATLARPDAPQRLADELVAMANRAGGRDNITVLVVDVVEATTADVHTPGGITTVPAPIGGWLANGATLAGGVPDASAGSVPVGAHSGGSPAAGDGRAVAGPAAGTDGPGASGAGAPDGAASFGPPALGEATTNLLGTKPPGRRAGRAAARRAGRAGTGQGSTRARGNRRPAPQWLGPVRNVVTVVVLAALAATAVGSIQAYGRAGWYVGFRNDAVTLYRGRPDGLLWVKPQAARLYNAHRSDLSQTWRDRIDRRITFTSAEAADRWFALLSTNPDAAPGIAPPATLPTTTTTTAPTTTTTAPTTTIDASTAVPNAAPTTATPPPAATGVAPTSSP